LPLDGTCSVDDVEGNGGSDDEDDGESSGLGPHGQFTSKRVVPAWRASAFRVPALPPCRCDKVVATGGEGDFGSDSDGGSGKGVGEGNGSASVDDDVSDGGDGGDECLRDGVPLGSSDDGDADDGISNGEPLGPGAPG